MSHTHRSTVAMVCAIAAAVGGAIGTRSWSAERSEGPSATTALASLLRQSGLRYTQPDEEGLCSVVFTGRNTNTVEVFLYEEHASADTEPMVVALVVAHTVEHSGDWPNDLMPWLLARNASTGQGAFALADDGKALIFINRVYLSGLTPDTLRDSLELSAVAVDDATPGIEGFLRMSAGDQ